MRVNVTLINDTKVCI